MSMLSNRKIVLGVGGGIAAYKSAELVRLLGKAGAEVHVVLSEGGARFVTPVTYQALSGNPVWSDLWDARMPNHMAHIDLGRDADAILVAPATADFLARLAHGHADDLLSTLCLARAVPLIVAPAMNRQMWESPPTQRNVAQIRADGVAVFGPAAGDQACGEVGMGRMLEAEELLERLEGFFVPKLLAGRKVVLTAGPTFEALDPVRGITNVSSGKMGYALARACAQAGAEVVLVSGPVSLPVPADVKRTSVTSALEMRDAVFAALHGADVFIGVAAVADYRPLASAEHKLKKTADTLNIALTPNPDILAEVAARADAPFCVGFAAESRDMVQHAREKLARKGVPMIVANLGPATFGRDDNECVIVENSGDTTLPRADKLTLARALVAHIADRLNAA